MQRKVVCDGFAVIKAFMTGEASTDVEELSTLNKRASEQLDALFIMNINIEISENIVKYLKLPS